MFPSTIVSSLLAMGLAGLSFSGFHPKPSPEKAIKLNVVYDSLGIKPGADTISYSKTKLVNWNDFKGAAPGDHPAAANSAVGFMYHAGVSGGREGITIDVRITSFFVRSLSWVKQKDKSDYILVHEQHHFDIARYGAELFRRKLLAATFTEARIGDIMNNAYQEAWNEYQQLQKTYDEESSHSLDAPGQEAWNKKIAAMLAQIP